MGVSVQGVKMEQGMVLDFNLLCSPQFYSKTSNIRTHFNHVKAALTNGSSSKIGTDFSIVHTRLCYKCKNGFIHQYVTLWGVSCLTEGVGAGSLFHTDFLSTFGRAICKWSAGFMIEISQGYLMNLGVATSEITLDSYFPLVYYYKNKSFKCWNIYSNVIEKILHVWYRLDLFALN